MDNRWIATNSHPFFVLEQEYFRDLSFGSIHRNKEIWECAA
jgi:hypothetical protein